MKSFSILVLGWMALGFTSGNSFNEKMPPRPLTDTQTQKLKPKVYFLPSRENRNKKLERIIHLMHLMELSCLERFAKPIYYENRFGHQRPFKNMKPLRRPAIRNYGNNLGVQMPPVYPTKQNQLLDNRKYFGNSRVIFVPPLVKVTEKRVNLTNNVNESKVKETLSSNKNFGQTSKEENKILGTNANISQNIGTPQSGSRNASIPKPNNKKEAETTDVTYIKILPPNPVSSKTDEKLAIEFPRVLGENPELPKSIISENEKLLKFPERPSFHAMKSKPVSNSKNASWHFLNHSKPNQVQQYEVEEIIEEKVSIDLRDKEDDGDETNEVKSHDKDTDFISKSINSVLKSLIHSGVETSTEKIKEASTHQKINTWPYQTSASPRLLKTFPNQRSESFLKKANENKPPFSREKQTKSFDIISSFENPKETTAKIQTEVTDSTPEAQYTKNAFTTDTGLPKEKSMKYTTQNVLETEENPEPTGVIGNLFHKTSTISETGTSTQKTTQLSFSDVIQDEDQTSPFFSISQETTKNEDFKTFPDAFEVSTTIEQKSTNTDEAESSSKPQTAPYTDRTDTTVNERDLTTFENQKLTNQPINFDLITVAKINFKKDKEAVGRKINFDEVTTETTAFNHISKTDSEEQRRSDILIAENLNDYLDIDNNNLSVSYWNRMLMKSPSVIPLIPVVINDLREGKLSEDDMSVLPEVFGKYWTTVVVLANNTNLDMLPLLKMKNEEDLKQVLQNLYPEYLESTTPSFTTTMSTTTTITTSTTGWENRKYNHYESYDYLDEYKDLYGDVLESEIEKNEKKQTDIRVKRDEEEELQKIEATLEYFESIEEEQIQKDYEDENVLYGKMSEEEDTNSLGLRLQMTDADDNLKNVTSTK